MNHEESADTYTNEWEHNQGDPRYSIGAGVTNRNPTSWFSAEQTSSSTFFGLFEIFSLTKN